MIRLLVYLYEKNRFLVACAALMGICGGLVGSGLLAVIDAAMAHPQNGARYALVFLALCFGSVLARIASGVILTRRMHHATYELRLSLARQLVAAPLARIEELGQAGLLSMLTEDITSITTALPSVLGLLPYLAIVAGCLAYMIWMSPMLFAVTVLMSVAGIGSFILMDVHVTRAFGRARESVDRLNGNFRALTVGIKELQHHAERRRIFLEREVEQSARTLRGHSLRANTIFLLSDNWIQAIYFLVLFVFLFVMPRYFGTPHTVASAFTLAVLFLSRPIEFTLTALPILSRARVALAKIDELGFSLDAREAPPRIRMPEVVSIELRHVEYAYDRRGEGSTFTLGPIDLLLKPGELVFMVGGNGSGKTTLAKLLGGLYSPLRGEILVNGECVAREDERYRQLFSAIYFDSHPFDSLMGLEATEQRAGEVLAMLRLDRKVRITDGRLSTTELSQGQKKRLLMLTALLEDRPIYIFDEWAAEQDPAFRETFYHDILPSLRAQNKAVFVITHDDDYFHVADRVLKLDYGKLLHHDTSTASTAVGARRRGTRPVAMPLPDRYT